MDWLPHSLQAPCHCLSAPPRAPDAEKPRPASSDATPCSSFSFYSQVSISDIIRHVCSRSLSTLPTWGEGSLFYSFREDPAAQEAPSKDMLDGQTENQGRQPTHKQAHSQVETLHWTSVWKMMCSVTQPCRRGSALRIKLKEDTAEQEILVWPTFIISHPK